MLRHNVVTLENMRHTRWARNPIIARTLTEFGWVRELNEGVDVLNLKEVEDG